MTNESKPGESTRIFLEKNDFSKTRTSATQIYRRGGFIFEGFFTQNQQMADCLKLAKDASKSDLAVLITGESGTGKNLLAQAIHNKSNRRDKSFVNINTSALSESLLQSELFGHEKGSFTGAEKQRKGHFEMAIGGTLVLDEIGDMGLTVQPQLLHAVEYKQFPRLGGEKLIHTDVRIIATTNQDLDVLVEEKKFRLDLLYRLREIAVCIPPLRERPDDMPLLCEVILAECRRKMKKRIVGVTDEAMDLLKRHSWPGNVRELKSMVYRAAVLTATDMIDVENIDIPQVKKDNDKSFPTPESAHIMSMEELEKNHILSTLEKAGGNKSRVVQLLGISRATLDRKIASYKE